MRATLASVSYTVSEGTQHSLEVLNKEVYAETVSASAAEYTH